LQESYKTCKFIVWAKFRAFAVTGGGISAGYYLGAKLYP